MKLSELTPEELELMSYTDLTFALLKENNKPMNTPSIFRKISDLLEYTEDDYVSKIGDYYTSLTIDKRFILLDNNEWDLRDNHPIEIELDDDDDIEIEIEEEEEEEEEIIEDETIYDDETDIVDEDDDMEDLAILSEDELDEDN